MKLRFNCQSKCKNDQQIYAKENIVSFLGKIWEQILTNLKIIKSTDIFKWAKT